MGMTNLYGVKEIFLNWIVVMATQLCKFTKYH